MNIKSSNGIFGDDAERALQTLMTRLKDVKNGFEKLVSEAQEDFEPIAREFKALHDKHIDKLRGKLEEHGYDVSEDGSFMSQVNEAVIAARSYFGTVDENVMASVRNGEQHVINAFDDAINKVENSKLCDELGAMRSELRDCVERTRHIG
ncbi:DUF2383 domain-containing protein [Roseobacter litoralis]|uniref:DUF2383 domain-containing protein n=1 Tax=Roseobacter litoralis TaxID=42443 RepID=UPI00248F91AB|nr:DUF2383 domain-containing protein [Roseobacter litoralis]